MKPLEGNFVQNALKYGVAGLNIDGCRVGTTENLNGGAYAKNGTERYDGTENWRYKRTGDETEFKQPTGRWPSNVILGHLEGCKKVGTKRVNANQSSKPGSGKGHALTENKGILNPGKGGVVRSSTADADGKETIDAWECDKSCPVKAIDKQSGNKCGASAPVKGTEESETGQKGIYGRYKRVASSFPDDGVGGASRFFKQVKEV